MVEREAQIPGDRAKIAAVIYNRLREGIPLGIDATIYYAVELATGIPTYTHELSEAQLHIDSPYNTRTAHRPAADADLKPRAGLDRSGGQPAHVPYLYYVAGADGCGEQVFSNTLAEFEAHAPPTRRRSKRTAGTRRPASTSDAAPRRPRLAGRAQPLAGDPQRRARRPRDGRLALPAAAGPPGAVRRDRRARSGSGLPRRERHDPAQARGAGARRHARATPRARSARRTR